MIERLARLDRPGGAACAAERRARSTSAAKTPRRSSARGAAGGDRRSRRDASRRATTPRPRRAASSSCARTTARRTSTAIDADFLASGDYAQIRTAAEVLHGLIGRRRGGQARRQAAGGQDRSRKRSTGCSREARDSGRHPALQGPGRDESRAAVGNDDGPDGAPPAAGADRGRDRRRTRSSRR